MKFLIDAQLPPRLAEYLTAAGHEAVHLYDALLPEASDVDVCAEANRRSAVLLTKDEDFVDFSTRGVLEVPLLWLRVGNMSNRAIWQKLEPLLPAIERAFATGDRIVEIR